MPTRGRTGSSPGNPAVFAFVSTSERGPGAGRAAEAGQVGGGTDLPISRSVASARTRVLKPVPRGVEERGGGAGGARGRGDRRRGRGPAPELVRAALRRRHRGGAHLLLA